MTEAPERSVETSFGRGLVGTGVHLLGHRGPWTEPRQVEVWLMVLFVPVLPLARWRVSVLEPVCEGAGSLLRARLRIHESSRVPPGVVLRRLLWSALGVVLTGLLLAFAVWKVGSPWASEMLSAVFGSWLGAGLLGKLGVAVELGTLLAGVALPVLVLMHLDARLPRVSVASALRQARHVDRSG